MIDFVVDNRTGTTTLLRDSKLSSLKLKKDYSLPCPERVEVKAQADSLASLAASLILPSDFDYLSSHLFFLFPASETGNVLGDSIPILL